MVVRPIDGNALQARLYRLGLWNDSKAAFYELIESMPTLTPPNEWVSVEERLPEPTYCALVYTTDYSIEVDAIGSDGEWMSFEVTHWMPLPAPPDRRPLEGEEDTR